MLEYRTECYYVNYDNALYQCCHDYCHKSALIHNSALYIQRHRFFSGDGFILKFTDDITYPYIKGLLNGFKFNLLTEKPLSIVVHSLKHIDTFKDYKEKNIIGNIEKIDIKELNLFDIDAKVDTGATTSCLNAKNIICNGNKVSFSPLKQSKTYTYLIQEKVRVQSSNGITELRPLIKLKIKISNKEIETYFSLTDRKKMDIDILLGKDLLGNFLIDPTKTL